MMGAMDNPLHDDHIHWDALLMVVVVVCGVSALLSEMIFNHVIINICVAFIALLALVTPIYRRVIRDRK